MNKDPYRLLFDYSLWLLGRRNYSEREMMKKLEQRSAKLKLPDAPALCQKVIIRLKELNYINDGRMVDDYFQYRLKNRPEGRFAFLQYARKKGISLELAKEQWGREEPDEIVLAEQAVLAKKRQLAGLPLQKKKQKIAQFLARRGFKADTVWKIIAKIS